MAGAEAVARVEALDKAMLTAHDVAPLLGCSAYAINLQAQANPAQLGFPVCVLGRRVKIPKSGFLAWYRGEGRPT